MRKLLTLLGIVFVFGFGAGWLVRAPMVKRVVASSSQSVEAKHPLHLNGYKLVTPLLLSDARADNPSSSLDALQAKLTTFIAEQKARRNVSEVSVYVRDFTTGYTMY